MTLSLQALPKKFTVGSVFSQEADYGSERGMLRRAPTTTTAHPLEESERMFDKHQEEQKMRSARNQFGIGFVAHMHHERAAVSLYCICMFMVLLSCL